MVYVALFIEYPTPFLREYFEKISKITYPKQRLAILIHNQVREERTAVDGSQTTSFSSVGYDMSEGEARQQAM